MIQILVSQESVDLTFQDENPDALQFVDQAEYEFVGGGNAVNAY